MLRDRCIVCQSTIYDVKFMTQSPISEQSFYALSPTKSLITIQKGSAFRKEPMHLNTSEQRN